jgi:hypothetical protein
MSFFSDIPLSGLIIGGFFTVAWGWILWVGARSSRRNARPGDHDTGPGAS